MGAGVACDGWEIERGEPEYPQELLELTSPPERIFGMGDRELLLTPCISIIGARRATPYGLTIAEMAARVAVSCGVTVVSGGALGCDHAAGLAALDAGGRTIVVSGCGADVIYPVSSRDLYEGALVRGGAVISVSPWGAGPRRWAFPRRNEVIAALGRALVVTEAGARSGTISTADSAIELGRSVYAIPGSIFSPNSIGTNRLISEGARVISDEQALSLAISLDYGSARLEQPHAKASAGPVMAALIASPSRPDELSIRLGESVLTVLKTLTDYEARGLAERLPDGRYSPTRACLLGHNGVA